jgi:tetratricopeptide (TPR) repeat protein
MHMNMKTLLVVALWFISASAIAQTDSSTVFLQKGNEAKIERKFLVASQAYQKSIQYNPQNMEAHKELGVVYVEMRKYDLARQSFNVVAKQASSDPVVVENLANLNFWTKKWNDAIAYAKKMQELKIGKNANYIIGKSYYELEDYGQAFPFLDAAAKEDATNADIPYTIGRGFVDMSNYRNAAPWFEKAIALDTNRPRWVYECALNFAAIPDDQNAVKYYLLAAEKGYKTDNDYYENLSTSYLGLGQSDKCIETLKKVLEKKPADIDLLNSIADIHYRIGKYTEAMDYWDKILGYDKKNAHALYMIGMCYQKKGDKSKGMQLCDQAIAMDPTLANLKQKKMNIGL